MPVVIDIAAFCRFRFRFRQSNNNFFSGNPWVDVQPNPPLTPDACNLTTPNGVIPDKNDCSKFFTCNNGLSVPGTCYFDLFFNNVTKKCDCLRNVNTENCTVTRKTPHPPTTRRISKVPGFSRFLDLLLLPSISFWNFTNTMSTMFSYTILPTFIEFILISFVWSKLL